MLLIRDENDPSEQMYAFQEQADDDFSNDLVEHFPSNVTDGDDSVFSDVVQDAFKKYQNEVENIPSTNKFIPPLMISVQFSRYWTYNDDDDSVVIFKDERIDIDNTGNDVSRYGIIDSLTKNSVMMRRYSLLIFNAQLCLLRIRITRRLIILFDFHSISSNLDFSFSKKNCTHKWKNAGIICLKKLVFPIHHRLQ